MDFYNPMARRSGAIRSQQIDPAGVPGSPNTGANGKFGYIDYDQLGTGQWGTGESFQGAGRQAALQALRSGQSDANSGDYQNLDALRGYYSNALAELPGLTQDNTTMADTNSQLGLRNGLRGLANQNAGTGRLGTRGYNDQRGGMFSRAASDLTTNLINQRNQAISRANTIGKGMEGVQGADLAQRQFQAEQGQRLSDLIYKMMTSDQSRDSQLAQMDAERGSADKRMAFGLASAGAESGAKAFKSAGGAIAASDSNAKTNVRDGKDAALRPFRTAKAQRYEYKDRAHGIGEHVSPMAQDLVKAGMGECVFAHNGVLHVDYGKALGRMFAAISALTAELDELKGRKRG